MNVSKAIIYDKNSAVSGNLRPVLNYNNPLINIDADKIKIILSKSPYSGDPKRISIMNIEMQTG
jgi:hypothetical protein